MVNWLDNIIHAMGPFGYLVLFGAALIEYVFPPFPGDSITLLGGVYAVRGEKPYALVLLAVTLGSIVGAAVDYAVGRRVARRIAAGKPTIGFTPERVKELERRVGRAGPWLLLGNRFLPGVRGIIFMGAGLVGVPFARVMLLGSLSALVWNVGLMAVGVALGGNAEKLSALMNQYNVFVYVVLGLVLLAVAIKVLTKALRRRDAM